MSDNETIASREGMFCRLLSICGRWALGGILSSRPYRSLRDGNYRGADYLSWFFSSHSPYSHFLSKEALLRIAEYVEGWGGRLAV